MELYLKQLCMCITNIQAVRFDRKQKTSIGLIFANMTDREEISQMQHFLAGFFRPYLTQQKDPKVLIVEGPTGDA